MDANVNMTKSGIRAEDVKNVPDANDMTVKLKAALKGAKRTKRPLATLILDGIAATDNLVLAEVDLAHAKELLTMARMELRTVAIQVKDSDFSLWKEGVLPKVIERFNGDKKEAITWFDNQMKAAKKVGLGRKKVKSKVGRKEKTKGSATKLSEKTMARNLMNVTNLANKARSRGIPAALVSDLEAKEIERIAAFVTTLCSSIIAAANAK